MIGKGLLIYILVLGFIVRMVAINQSLWLDEATTALVARDLSWNQFWGDFMLHDFHPPAYYALIKVWGSIFGFSEIALRMPSIIFGLVSIYFIFRIGKQIESTSVAVIAALLLSTSSLHIYYSQEARMYMMATAWVTAASFYFIKTLKDKNLIYFINLSILLALIFLTDYLSVLILAAFWIYALINTRDKKWWGTFVASHIPLVVSVAAFWNIFYTQLTNGLAVKSSTPQWWDVLGQLSIKNILLVPIKLMIGRISFESNFVYISYLSFIFLFVLISLIYYLKNNKNRFFIYWVAVPLILGFVISLFVPVFLYFRFLFVLPAIYLAISLGLHKMPDLLFLPVFGMIILGNFISSSTYLGNYEFYREDWRQTVNYINNDPEAGKSAVVFVSDSQHEAYRYYDPDRTLYSGADEVNDDFDTIYLMRYVVDIFDPDDSVRVNIEEKGFTKVDERNFNNVVVYKYENSN